MAAKQSSIGTAGQMNDLHLLKIPSASDWSCRWQQPLEMMEIRYGASTEIKPNLNPCEVSGNPVLDLKWGEYEKWEWPQAGENWKGAVVLLSKWKMTPAEISLQVVYTDSCGCWKGCAIDICWVMARKRLKEGEKGFSVSYSGSFCGRQQDKSCHGRDAGWRWVRGVSPLQLGVVCWWHKHKEGQCWPVPSRLPW